MVNSLDFMALNELTPILQELTKEPIAFCSGFISGALRLNLTDDPVKTWLEKQTGYTPTANERAEVSERRGPQSIDID